MLQSSIKHTSADLIFTWKNNYVIRGRNLTFSGLHDYDLLLPGRIVLARSLNANTIYYLLKIAVRRALLLLLLLPQS